MTIFSLVSVYAYEDPSKNCDNTSTFIERSGRVGVSLHVFYVVTLNVL